jgi:hypothetical protein
MDDFLKRFRALVYDHPWHGFPYLLGPFFIGVSTADWSLQLFRGREPRSFVRSLAFSAALALVVLFMDRTRERRSRQG